MNGRNPLLVTLILFAVLLMALLAFIAWRVAPLYRYGQRSQRIWEKLYTMKQRRPPTVDPRLWDESVGWAVTAHSNVCFSEGHASYEAMCRFEEELDEKLAGDIDLPTIEWIGERLAETGPHGQRYMADWRLQWKVIQEEWKQEAPSPGQGSPVVP